MSIKQAVRRAVRRVGRSWNCSECPTLLGTYDESSMRLKYKQAAYEIRGSDLVVVAICRNCGTENRLSRPDRPR
jgi:RNase P subunit RPR2